MKRKVDTKKTSKKKEVKPTKKKSLIAKKGKSKLTKTKKPVKKKVSGLNLTKADKDSLNLHQTLKLQIELVPESCWFANVRSNTTQGQWDKIRRASYQKANYICEICGGKGEHHPVECHEIWIYDDESLTQRLGTFQAICPSCHEVKHFGLATLRGNGEKAFNHFLTINQLDEGTGRKVKAAVFKQWRIRSKKKWNLEIDLLSNYGIDTSELLNKQKQRIQKTAPKHFLHVQRNMDKDFLNQIIDITKEENPNYEIILIYEDEVGREDLSKTPPSKITTQYWVHAVRKEGKYPKPTKKSGKWLIFRDKNLIDKVWDEVKLATETGLLGHASKVSTGKENPNGRNNKGVICVYTYNWTDEDDVKKIRKELQQLGITEKIGYKSDQDTIEGKYSTAGHTQISKYWE